SRASAMYLPRACPWHLWDVAGLSFALIPGRRFVIVSLHLATVGTEVPRVPYHFCAFWSSRFLADLRRSSRLETGPEIGADSGWAGSGWAGSGWGRCAGNRRQMRRPPKNWSRSDTLHREKYPNATTARRGSAPRLEEDAPAPRRGRSPAPRRGHARRFDEGASKMT